MKSLIVAQAYTRLHRIALWIRFLYFYVTATRWGERPISLAVRTATHTYSLFYTDNVQQLILAELFLAVLRLCHKNMCMVLEKEYASVDEIPYTIASK